MPPRPASPPPVVFEPMMVSASMRRVRATIATVAPKDVVVTLIGESGSGKEVLARLIHELSDRRAGPFVPINCAAIPEALFESELFGHERGAFTGANERARGKIEAAQGGTLFLDELGEMPLGLQAKLLRFLEGRRYMRVGGTVKLEADIRLVCATLRPLEEEMRAGRFRPDLYYRIQGITVLVPPLRERRADLPGLLDHFFAEMASRHGIQRPRLTRPVRARLEAYDWPGNVRELRNCVEGLSLLHAGTSLRVADLPAAIQAATGASAGGGRATGSAATGSADTSATDTARITLTLDKPLAELEDQIVAAVLTAEGGHLGRTAARLGVSVRTLQRRRARK